MKRTLIILGGVLCGLSAVRPAEAAEPRTPRLIVNIVVGSMRAEDIARYNDNFGEGGIRRIVEGGTVYTGSRYD